MKQKLEHEVIIGSVILATILIFTFVLGYDLFSYTINGIQELNLEIPDDNFTHFALAVTFFYDAMPSIAQQFSIGAITAQLLLTGFSPILLVIISALGLLMGQMALYGVGMVIKKVHKGSIGDIAGKNHWLHKYHFLVYMAIPFLNIVGDLAMLYSGHQRTNPLKMIPFLFVADLASSARWILPSVAQLGIGESLQ